MLQPAGALSIPLAVGRLGQRIHCFNNFTAGRTAATYTAAMCHMQTRDSNKIAKKLSAPAGTLVWHCEVLPCPLGEPVPQRLGGSNGGPRSLEHLNTQLQQLDAQALTCVRVCVCGGGGWGDKSA
jgi:hypothetical protein